MPYVEPREWLGHYRVARRLALAASQAAGVLWEFQWTNATKFALVHRVTLKASQPANGTAVEARFNLEIARSFTAVDATNTASVKPAVAMQKLRTSFPDSVVGDIRESNSATAAAGGTKTLDGNPIAVGSFVQLATAGTTVPTSSVPVFDYEPHRDEYPLVLAQNEGWVIQLESALGATDGVVLDLEVAWAEVTAF